MPTKYSYGLGRRKAATARARLYKGKGEITINNKVALDYLSGNKSLLAEVTDPLALAGKQKEFDVTILVSGGQETRTVLQALSKQKIPLRGYFLLH